MLSLLLAVPSCIYSFWHGVIPTSYFIFNDFYPCSNEDEDIDSSDCDTDSDSDHEYVFSYIHHEMNMFKGHDIIIEHMMAGSYKPRSFH